MQRLFLVALCVFVLLALSFCALPAISQAATPKLDVDDYRNLDYRIEPTTDGVSAAWIEVWDRPKLLSRISLPIKSHGQVRWREGVEHTPEQLYVALNDPDAPLHCVDNCNYSAAEWAALRRDATSADLMVGIGPEGEWEMPVLDAAVFRVPVGNGDHSFVLRGRYLTSSTRIRLIEEEPGTGIWRWGDYCQTEILHPWELHVTVPGRNLTFGHRLAFAVEESVGEASAETVYRSQAAHNAIINVACLDSPVLDSVEPATLPADASEPKPEAGEKGVPVTLRGRGFGPSSTVIIDEGSLGEWSPKNLEFVSGLELLSSQEMQIKVGSYDLWRAINDGQELRLSIGDSSHPCRLSESKTIQVLPSGTIRPDPVPGTILTVLPYPVPLMDAYSPELIELQIIGENFRPNVTAVAYADDIQSTPTKLNTRFVSSQELRADLPRELWRTHRLSYRFVISTHAGDKAVEVIEGD